MKYSIHFFIRLWIRLTSYFFFEKIEVSGIENLPLEGPVILASNHPDAFLDSLVMTTCIKRSFYYTARGDAFKSKTAAGLLDYIQILPLYRREEGKELMHKNNDTFSNCLKIFKKNGAVSIFSEGISENEWALRPLRKGTARIAFEAWNNPEIGDRLKVVPVVIHYSSWLKICPRVYIEFLENIEKKSFEGITENGTLNKLFNEKLNLLLSEKCVIVDKSDAASVQNKMVGFLLKNFNDGTKTARRIQDKYLTEGNEKFKTDYFTLSEFLVKENITYYRKSAVGVITFIFSSLVFVFAYLLNALPYFISKSIARKTTKGNDFHDSVLYCTLLLIYPVYLIAFFFILKIYASLWLGISFVAVSLICAALYEGAKRNINCFFKKEKLKTAKQLLNQLFETSNG